MTRTSPTSRSSRRSRSTRPSSERLAGALRKRLQRDVRMHCTVDPTLIGGAIVRSGDLLIDGSLKGKLETARKQN